MNLANRITFFRLFLIPVFLGLVITYTGERQWIRNAAAAVFIVAALSDVADGYVARKFVQSTRLGKLLDPLADKLLTNLAFIFLAVNPVFGETVPLWLPVVVMLRDSIIISVSFLLDKYAGPIKVKPRLLGKIATWGHGIGIAGVLLGVSFAWELLLVMLFFTVVSSLDYIFFGWEKVIVRDGNEGEASRVEG